MPNQNPNVTDRFAVILYEAAVSLGLEGRFDYSLVSGDYEDLAREVLRRMFPPPSTGTPT